MPLESAQYINTLDSANPVGTDPVAFLDDHIRLIKAAIKATFPNITGPLTKTVAQLENPFPVGMITLWSGSTGSVPSGWALCDGNNGTPDLRNRFVVGAGSTYAAGAVGGSKDAVVVSHTHTATAANQNINHTHSFSGTSSIDGTHYHFAAGKANGSGWDGPTADSVIPSSTISDGNWQYAMGSGVTTANVGKTSENGQHSHTFSGTTGASSGDHTHGITVTATGEAGTDKNLPPYYALAYIMKI